MMAVQQNEVNREHISAILFVFLVCMYADTADAAAQSLKALADSHNLAGLINCMNAEGKIFFLHEPFIEVGEGAERYKYERRSEGSREVIACAYSKAYAGNNPEAGGCR